MAKDAYDAILADGATSAATDLEYAGCLISRVSKIPPFYFPQFPGEITAGKWTLTLFSENILKIKKWIRK